jgi:hypothetical protein
LGSLFLCLLQHVKRESAARILQFVFASAGETNPAFNLRFKCGLLFITAKCTAIIQKQVPQLNDNRASRGTSLLTLNFFCFQHASFVLCLSRVPHATKSAALRIFV